MALSKKISKNLLEEDDIPEEIEHDLIKDSVLQIVNTDFKVTDDFDDLPVGQIRLNAAEDLSAEYEGKPVSRKSFSQRNWIDENSDTDLDSNDGQGNDFDDEHVEAEQFSGDEEALESDDEFVENEEENQDVSENESVKSYGESENGSVEHDPEKRKRTKQDASDINIFSSRIKNVDDDIKKGNAIKNQLVLWENIIECRIKLQKGLASCNRLPQKDSFSDLISQLTPKEKSSVNSAYEGLIDLLENFIKLRECLLKKCPDYVNFKKGRTTNVSLHNNFGDDEEEITSESENEKEEEEMMEDVENSEEDSPPPLKKRKTLDDYSGCLKSASTDYKMFRDFVIQKWNDKTRLASGKIGISKFAILEQSTLKQIEQILLDKDRLLKRTQTRRSKLPVLGKEKKVTIENDADEEKNDDDVEEDDVRKKESSLEVLDTEIFDDDDFYHKLLKDFIDRKTSDITDPTKLGRQWTKLQKLRSKMKKKIDTRATKGRKIRYTVHNQLVNFMAPIPYSTWDDKVEQDLFRSLFGQASQALQTIAPSS